MIQVRQKRPLYKYYATVSQGRQTTQLTNHMATTYVHLPEMDLSLLESDKEPSAPDAPSVACSFFLIISTLLHQKG